MKGRLIAFLSLWFVGAVAAPAQEDPRGLEQVRAAAEAGDADAQLQLGILYEYGFRKPDHLVPALSWYLRAVDGGNAAAVQRRDALLAKLKPDEIEQAKRLAKESVAATATHKPATAADTP